MPEGLQVRRADADDVALLGELILAFRDHLHASFPPRDGLRGYLPSAIADPDLEFYVAVDSGEAPLGYAHVRFFPSIWALGTEAFLEDLFVHDAARGQGVGKALLAFVLDRAKERSARSIGLTTNEQNTEGQAVYRRLGFSPQAHDVYVDGREIRWQRSLD